jgi:GTP-binding protein HflX
MEKINISKAVLAGLVKDAKEAEKEERLLDELERLLETAGGEAAARIVQTRENPDPATYFGIGKINELKTFCTANNIGLVVFDSELSPSQINNLEEMLGGDIEVIDRSMLILDIFAMHATSGEGKLQVELAQLKYTAPRLIGKGKNMSRLGGGIGTRGPGESKLETDRRHLKRRIAALEAELEQLEKNRATMRLSRDKSGIVKAAIVGYTNAGKSTLLNRLTDAGILAEDKLFATLDPTTRKYTLPGGECILLTDTVGFIRKLPHHLIEAFKSTLDEAVCADILIIVVDASDPEFNEHLEVTENLLAELGASGKPTLYVFNKCDRGALGAVPYVNGNSKQTVFISATSGQGIDQLTAKLEEMVKNGKKKIKYLIPHSEAAALNILYKNAAVENAEYLDDGVLVIATVDRKTQGLMKKFETE